MVPLLFVLVPSGMVCSQSGSFERGFWQAVCFGSCEACSLLFITVCRCPAAQHTVV